MCTIRLIATHCSLLLHAMKYAYYKAGNTLRHGVRQICLRVLVYMVHHATANRLGLPLVLHTLIHRLLVHQTEPKPSMLWGCAPHRAQCGHAICSFAWARVRTSKQIFYKLFPQTFLKVIFTNVYFIFKVFLLTYILFLKFFFANVYFVLKIIECRMCDAIFW